MQNLLRPRRRTLAALCAGLALAGCASDPVMVAPAAKAGFRNLGPAEGSACGSLLIIATAYNFIPAGLNSRVERAYANALQSVPGATSLINVKMQENWYWFVLGTMRCVTITGEAVK
ncbi:hypothetical protein [Nevskia soli]|uniref:hypothetical protein n=1 Tax=Nevskia soli TaxID=418856 RepID=UPI001B8096E6|nr:hypothetical protein [Nevskia soli]